ncbi:MAG: hypothetical protein HYS23_13210 [Geobacter sp.]|nr:hypothetical protein [Geobacter sp.]
MRLLTLLMLTLTLLLTGCGFLLPSTKDTIESPWKTFEDVKISFDKIVPGQTSVSELKKLGFDIESTPNLRILNYLDIAGSVQSIRMENLDEGLKECLIAKTACRAFVFEPKRVYSKRIGNFWLDFFNFRRKSKETGWQFKALLVLVDDHVTYKLWSGTPTIEAYKDQRNPLGPLQGASDFLLSLP